MKAITTKSNASRTRIIADDGDGKGVGQRLRPASGGAVMDRPIVAFIAWFIATSLTLAVFIAATTNECGVRRGESCGTDTECECMHGADK